MYGYCVLVIIHLFSKATDMCPVALVYYLFLPSNSEHLHHCYIVIAARKL